MSIQSTALVRQLLVKNADPLQLDCQQESPLSVAKKVIPESPSPSAGTNWDLEGTKSTALTIVESLQKSAVQKEVETLGRIRRSFFENDERVSATASPSSSSPVPPQAPISLATEITPVAEITALTIDEEIPENIISEDILEEEVAPEHVTVAGVVANNGNALSDHENDDDNDDDGSDYSDLKNATKEEWLALGLPLHEFHAMKNKKTPDSVVAVKQQQQQQQQNTSSESQQNLSILTSRNTTETSLPDLGLQDAAPAQVPAADGVKEDVRSSPVLRKQYTAMSYASATKSVTHTTTNANTNTNTTNTTANSSSVSLTGSVKSGRKVPANGEAIVPQGVQPTTQQPNTPSEYPSSPSSPKKRKKKRQSGHRKNASGGDGSRPESPREANSVPGSPLMVDPRPISVLSQAPTAIQFPLSPEASDAAILSSALPAEDLVSPSDAYSAFVEQNNGNSNSNNNINSDGGESTRKLKRIWSETELLRSQLREKHQQEEEWRGKAEELERQLDAKQKLFDMLGMQIESQRKSLAQIQTDLEAKGKDADALQCKEKEASEQRLKLQNLLQYRDNELQSKDKEIHALKTTSNAKDHELQALKSSAKELVTLQQTVQAKDQELQGLRATIQSRDQEIQELQQVNQTLRKEESERQSAKLANTYLDEQESSTVDLTMTQWQQQLQTEIEYRKQAEQEAEEVKFRLAEVTEELKESEIKFQQQRTEVSFNDDRFESLQVEVKTLRESLEENKRLLDREHNTAQECKQRAEEADQEARKHHDAAKQETQLRERYEDKCLKFQGELEMVKKELNIERSSVEAQRQELTLLRSGKGEDTRGYLDVIRSQLDEERAVRQRLELDHGKALKSLESSERLLQEIQALYQQEVQTGKELREQKTLFESSLLKANQEVVSVQGRLEEAQRLASQARSHLDRSEKTLRTQQQDIQLLQQREKDLTKSLGERTKELVQEKENLRRTQESLEHAQAQGDELIQSLEHKLGATTEDQEQLKTQLQQTHSELERTRKQFEASKQEWQSEQEQVISALAEAQKLGSDLKQSVARAEAYGKEVDSKAIQIQSRLQQTEAAFTETSTKLQLANEDNRLLREKNIHLEQTLPVVELKLQQSLGEYQKAEQMILRLQESIGKLEGNLSAKEHSIVELEKRQQLIQTDRDGLRKELTQNQQLRSEESQQRQQSAVQSEKALQSLETFVKRLTERIPLLTKVDEFSDTKSGSFDRLDAHGRLWKETEKQLGACLDGHVEMWSELLYHYETDTIAGKAISKAIAAMSHLYEKTTAVQARTILTKYGRVHRQVGAAWNADALQRQQDLESVERALKAKELAMANLEQRLPTIELVQSLQAQNKELTLKVQAAEVNIELLAAELREVDSEYADEFQSGARVVMGLPRSQPSFLNTSGSGAVPLPASLLEKSSFSTSVSANSATTTTNSTTENKNIQNILNEHKSLKRQIIQQDTKARIELMEQVNSLKTTVVKLESEHRSAQECWSRTKGTMEAQHATEKQDLLSQIRQNNEAIDRMEDMLKKAHALSTAASKAADRKELYLLMEKVEKLRLERESMLTIHTENIKTMQNGYERQLQKYMDEIRELKRQLELAIAQRRLAEQENASLKSEMLQIQVRDQRSQLSKSQLERTVAEMKVLVTPRKCP